jgi:hypothetical protein
MKKSVIIFLSIVLLILLVFAIWYFLNLKDSKTLSSSNPSSNLMNVSTSVTKNNNINLSLFTCEIFYDEKLLAECKSKKEDNSLDESICKSIKEDIPKFVCYSQFAKIKNSTEICDNINNLEYNKICKDSIRLMNGDESVCNEQQGDAKWYCFGSLSLKDNNLSYCEKIVPIEIKDDCFYNNAVALREDNVCTKIQTKSIIERCYRDIAWVTKDNSYCEKIETPYVKETCLKMSQ